MKRFTVFPRVLVCFVESSHSGLDKTAFYLKVWSEKMKWRHLLNKQLQNRSDCDWTEQIPLRMWKVTTHLPGGPQSHIRSWTHAVNVSLCWWRSSLKGNISYVLWSPLHSKSAVLTKGSSTSLCFLQLVSLISISRRFSRLDQPVSQWASSQI